jgi:anti-sigma-K factor RskA
MSPDLHHLSGAYAVDALDDAERTSFEQHLAVCADCRAEVAELSATAHSLASLSESTPPPSLRAAVLTGIAQVRPLPPLTQDAGAPDVPATAPTPPPVAAPDEAEDVQPDAGGTVVPIRRRPRTAWFAAAAAAAVVAIGGVALSPWSDDSGTQSPMAQVAAAADAMTVSSTKDGITTQVAYSKQLGQSAISVKGLPPAPDGKTYQLWYVGATGAATSAGLLGVDAAGTGQALLTGRATPTDKVAVTVEPAGGSEQPTSEPVVVLALA